MTQEQLDALLAQIGGGRLSYAPIAEKKTVPNPARVNPDGTTNYLKPKEIEVTIQRWHDPSSGRVVEAYPTGDGTWAVLRNGVDKSLINVGATPDAPAAPRSAAEQRTAREEAEIAWHAALPPDQDPRSETKAEREARAERTRKEQAEAAAKNGPKVKQDAVPGYPGWTYVTQKDAQGNELTLYYSPGSDKPQSALPEKPAAVAAPQAGKPYKNAAGQWVQPIADANGNITGTRPVPPEAVPPDAEKDGEKAGQPYKNAQGQWVQPIADATGRVVRTEPLAPEAAPAEKPEKPERLQDPETKQWLERQPDGTWKPIEIQGQNQTGNQGPPLPHRVLGEMKDGLTEYREELTRQTGLGIISAATARARWQEAADIAELGIREAALVNSEENSRRSADVSLRTNAMSNSTSGFNSALSFVQHLNDRLPIGSRAGGKALAVILGMQHAQAQRMGAYENQFSDPSAPRGAPSASRTAPAAAAPDRRPPMEVGAPAPPNAIGAGAVPSSITPATAVTAPVSAAAIPPVSPAGVSNLTEADGTPRARTPASSTVGTGVPPGVPPVNSAPPPPLTGPQAPGNGPLLNVRDQWGNEYQMTQQQIDSRPKGSGGMTVVGTAAPEPVGMTAPPPEEDYGVMQGLRQMDVSAPIPGVEVPAAPPVDAGPMPGVLRAQMIAQTPPWRLQDDDLEWAQANGLLSQAMAVPRFGT